MEILNTARLVAEPLSLDHLADLTTLHQDVEVGRYLGGVRSPEATRAYVEVNLEHWRRTGLGLWVWRTCDDGVFIGRGGIRPLAVEGVAEIEIAYALRCEAWGRGYASEMAQAMTAVGLARPGILSLVGVVFTGNLASRHVLEKAGFGLERPVVHAGEACVLYRRLRAEDGG